MTKEQIENDFCFYCGKNFRDLRQHLKADEINPKKHTFSPIRIHKEDN